MILPSTFVRISLAAVLAIAAVGCRKGDKNLTPIPGGSGNFVGGGNDNPAGSMMSGDNDNLGGGNQFNNNDFQTGDDIGNGAGNLNVVVFRTILTSLLAKQKHVWSLPSFILISTAIRSSRVSYPKLSRSLRG